MPPARKPRKPQKPKPDPKTKPDPKADAKKKADLAAARKAAKSKRDNEAGKKKYKVTPKEGYTPRKDSIIELYYNTLGKGTKTADQLIAAAEKANWQFPKRKEVPDRGFHLSTIRYLVKRGDFTEVT